MGIYVNPTDQTKENFLKKNGKRIEQTCKWEKIPQGYLPVVLINNLAFSAAAIGFNKREFEYLTAPEDSREKKIYLVCTSKLLESANGLSEQLDINYLDKLRKG